MEQNNFTQSHWAHLHTFEKHRKQWCYLLPCSLTNQTGGHEVIGSWHLPPRVHFNIPFWMFNVQDTWFSETAGALSPALSPAKCQSLFFTVLYLCSPRWWQAWSEARKTMWGVSSREREGWYRVRQEPFICFLCEKENVIVESLYNKVFIGSLDFFGNLKTNW